MIGGGLLWVLVGGFVLWAVAESLWERRAKKRDKYWEYNR